MGVIKSDEKTIAASITAAGESVWDTIEEAAEGALDKVKGIFGR